MKLLVRTPSFKTTKRNIHIYIYIYMTSQDFTVNDNGHIKLKSYMSLNYFVIFISSSMQNGDNTLQIGHDICHIHIN
jgi:hypothetical protein